MANKKISDLTAKGATIAANDKIEIAEYVSPGVFTSKSVTGAELGVLDTFLELTDTPNTFTGNSLKVARVNAGETALEFATVSGGATAFTGLSDVPASYTGQSLKVVRVNAGETALEFATVSVSDTNIANSDLTISATGTRKLRFAGYAATDVFRFNSYGDTPMVTITGQGNMGINVDAPAYVLDVQGTGYNGPLRIRNQSGNVLIQTNNNNYVELNTFNFSQFGLGCSSAFGDVVRIDGMSVLINGLNSGTTVFKVWQQGVVDFGNTGLGIGSVTNTLRMVNGTAPSSNITDSYQLYSADITAGNAAPHFRTENGNIIKLYQETTGVTAATLVGNAGTALTDTDTFDGYTLKQVVKALRNLGILA